MVGPSQVQQWRDALPGGDEMAGLGEAQLVDLIAELERLKSAACAVQAHAAVLFDRATRAREAGQGVAAARRGRGVASQIGLARQESPHRGRMLLGLAHDLVTDLPHTLRAVSEGRLSEYRAMLVARETGCLDSADRRRVDADVCGDRDLLDGLGTRSLVGELRRRVYAADPAAVVRRHARAEADRHVSLRPAPDTMCYLTGLLPVAQGVAAFAALGRDADALRAAGDERSRGQLMSDLLVERLTGQSVATDVPVCIDLVISDATLFGAGHEPATVPGWGPVPAQVARGLVASALDADADTWLRRVYADASGQLVAMTSRQRFAPDGLADLVGIRDQGLCRTPWCDAPARHSDHVVPVTDGGETTESNLQGLCEACNHAKQAPGWTQSVVPGVGPHTVETITPTGHRHRSRAPAPPAPAPPTRPVRPVRADGIAIEFYEIDCVLEYDAA